ncbi:hypothetical protein GCM10011519_35170 [Marmoricola endophyticus]|uniref:DUF2567 domain-containing protein n=1 Tax=Marmoricola endophyticus TaxID=2040280 RepID=A0A917BTL5_9ACTN|nr:hypothetical protein GCM10011519_35170 [Marmoricola endophyticus]
MLVVFVVLGLVAGVVWQWVATAPTVLRTEDNAVMDQAQLGVKVSADGWFAVVGVVGGLVAGFGLLRPRRDPLLVVVLGIVASVGAAYLALWLGGALAHVPRSEIRAARPGTTLTTSLTLISHAVVLAWPLGFLVAATASLWGAEKQTRP